ncbi:MAG: DUF3352 domain-containing protein [Planctomycetes bacterium]|nr:DUF3352 domain-containing protein [Planctomycetota bacterium]
MRHALVLTLIALVALAPAAAQDTKTPRLEELVPENTFLLASIPDLPAVTAGCKQTALAALVHDEEVQRFLAPLGKFIEQGLAEVERELGHPLSSIYAMLKGQIAVAVVHFDPMQGGMVPDVAFYADLGSSVSDFRKLHEELLAKGGEEMGVRESEHRGVKIWTMAVPPGIDISMACLGNALVVTTRPERMAAMIDAAQAGLPASLAANQTFRRVGELTGGAGKMLDVFVNVESILGYFAEQMEPEVMRGLEKSGITSIKGAGWGSSFSAEGVRDSLTVYAPGEKRGFLALPYASKGDGTGLLARMPREAFYAASGSMNFAAFYGILLETLGAIEPSALDEATGYIQHFEEVMGLRLLEDLLVPMGEEFGFYSAMPDGGGLIPDLVLLMRPKDPAKLLATLDQLVAKIGAMAEDSGDAKVEHRRMDFSGREIHYVHVTQRWGDPFPVTPCYVLHGDLVAFGLYPQVLKDFVARPIDAPAVLTRPDFQRVVKGLPEGLASLEYMDLAAGVRLLYGTLVPIAQMFGKSEEIPLDMALLPRTAIVAKHFFGMATGMKLDADGFTMHCYSPTGLMPFMAAMMGVGYFTASRAQAVRPPDVWVQPEPYRPDEEPMEADGVEAQRLHDLYVALLEYFSKREDYPAEIGQLVEAECLDSAEALVLPGDPEPASTASGHKTSFGYAGGGVGHVLDRQDEAVWIYERDGLREEARWVLFASGRVRLVPEEEFRKLLSETLKLIGK